MRKEDISLIDDSINLFYVLQRKFNLSEAERDELQSDMGTLILRGEEKWKSAGSPHGFCKLYCNERLGERYFRVQLTVDYGYSLLDIGEFSELSLDEYLDSINFSNNELKEDGYKEI